MCGNWNGNYIDDMYPYGSNEKGTYSEIGMSYKVNSENDTEPA